MGEVTVMPEITDPMEVVCWDCEWRGAQVPVREVPCGEDRRDWEFAPCPACGEELAVDWDRRIEALELA